MARPSLFSPKDPASRFQGLTTKVGAKKLEEARAALGALAGLTPAQVSDGDVVEYLARGRSESQRVLVQSRLLKKLKG